MPAHFSEERVVVAKPDVLEHADRDDPVERFSHGAIILQAKFERVGQVLFAGALPGDRKLLLRQCDAGDFRAAEFGEIKPEPAPAAADVEHAAVGALADEKLGGEMALLGELRVVERLVGRLEISAAVLPVGVEEERIEPAVQIVVVGDITPRPGGQIELLQPALEVAGEPLRTSPDRRHSVGRLAEHEGKEIGDCAFLDLQRAVHVGFADLHLGVEHHCALRRLAGETQRHRSSGAVAEVKNPSFRRGNAQVATPDKSPQSPLKQPVHGRLQHP